MSQGTGSTLGEVAEWLPLVAFRPLDRGPSREMRRSCHVISLTRKTWSRLVRRATITRKTGYQCVTSFMFYAAPWWHVCTWEAPLNPTPAWDRTTLDEFVPPKPGDPGSVFYLPRDSTCGGKRGRVWSHQQDHHAKEYQDRATAEKRERYLKSGWSQGTGSAFGEVAEWLPLVAFGPQGGPSREKTAN